MVSEAVVEFLSAKMGSAEDVQAFAEKFKQDMTQKLNAIASRKSKELKEQVKRESKQVLEQLKNRIVSENLSITALEQNIHEALEGLRKRYNWRSDEEAPARAAAKVFAQRRCELLYFCLERYSKSHTQTINELKTKLSEQTFRQKAMEDELENYQNNAMLSQAEANNWQKLVIEKSAIIDELKDRIKRLESKLDLREEEFMQAMS